MLEVRLWAPTGELDVISFDFIGKCAVTDTIKDVKRRGRGGAGNGDKGFTLISVTV